jgi:hypothetical protein
LFLDQNLLLVLLPLSLLPFLMLLEIVEDVMKKPRVVVGETQVAHRLGKYRGAP